MEKYSKVQWYTSEEIMEMFKISKQTLYRWRKLGTIEFVALNSRNFRYKFPKLFEKRDHSQ